MSPTYFRPILPLLFSLIIGIILGCLYPGGAKWAYMLFVGVFGFLVFKIGISKTSVSLPVFLFICLGYLSIQCWISPIYPKNHVIHFTNNQVWEICGTLSDDPRIKNHRTQCFLTVGSLSKKSGLDESGCSFDACGKIRLTILGPRAGLAKGDVIRFRSKLRPIRNFSNPGGYDYKTHMAFEGIRGSAYAASDKVEVLKAESASSAPLTLSFRDKIDRQIDISASSTAEGVIKALILGDRFEMGAQLKEKINRSGLSHLLAISGLHIGIVASFSFFVCRWFLSYCPWLIRHARTKKFAAMVSIVPVVFYGWFSGMSPSTQRAVIMVSAFMMTFLIERENDPLNTLAWAALIILVVFPPSLFFVSFQLSFAAVWVIIAGMSLMPTFSRPEFPLAAKAMNYLLSFFAVSFLATLGTLPLVMYYFNQVSVIGWVSNMVGIPLIGFLVVPLGLLSTVMGFFSMELAGMGFFLSGKIVDFALVAIEFLADLDFAAVKTITPNIFEIIWFYILLGSLFYFRKMGWLKYVVLCACLVLVADTGYWVHRRYLSNDLRITVFDVGQGFGSLAELPGGRTMMIDGGGFSDNSVFDVGHRLIAPYLWRNKIKTVDLLIVSHPDTDHYNGLTYIADNFNVKTIWTNGEPCSTYSYKMFLQVAEKNHILIPEFASIPRNQNINGVVLKILHPSIDFKISPIMAKYSESNDHSIVIQMNYKRASFLFPGDISQKIEGKMVSLWGNDIHSAVLISPHHGSESSSSGVFLSHVNPETVIIPVGFKNRFHFPHEAVLKRYEQNEINIYRTDLDGAVCIKTDGEKLFFRPTIPANEKWLVKRK